MKCSALVALLSLSACASPTWTEMGRDALRSSKTSDSMFNRFACTDCHAERGEDVGSRILPGAVLQGVTARASWWGGSVLDLHQATTLCFQRFMAGGEFARNSDVAQSMLAYLELLNTTATASQRSPVAFTVPVPIADLPLGNVQRGEVVYNNACVRCHGALHTGAGRLTEFATVIPEDTFAEHLADYGPACTRVVVIEKIRHGNFLGYAGRMPPFSKEVLSDEQLSDLLAYVGMPDGGVCSP